MTAFILVAAFVAGLLSRRLGYPPLLGYLLAGFVAHGFGYGNLEAIAPIAELGVTLLLFTIGLKLNLQQFRSHRVWGTALLHAGLVIPLTAAVISAAAYLLPLLALEDPRQAWVLAFALSFSSTVFAVKMFEERGEQGARHADLAIGILIFQDLMAVIYLVATMDQLPGLSALALLGLPLLRPLLVRVLKAAGHGELLTLFGVSLALGGAELFDLVNLKGSLGALVFGVLVGNTAKATELYRALIGFKDIFLIGFFLQIGFYGLPSAPMMAVALVLGLLVFLRPLIYFALLVAQRLRARTAMLTGFSLFNYSEFGLIVAAISVETGILPPQWLTTLALAVCLSFFIATPFNTRVHSLYYRFADWLHRFERADRLPEERPASLGDAEVVILGMGRVGHGAYEYLKENYGDKVVGVEENYAKAEELQRSGIRCVHGDAIDRDFWEQVAIHNRKLVLVSLTSFRENMAVVKLARRLDYSHTMAVTCRYPDEIKEIEAAGCIPFYLYQDVGRSFAAEALENWREGHLPAPEGN